MKVNFIINESEVQYLNRAIASSCDREGVETHYSLGMFYRGFFFGSFFLDRT